MKKLLQLITGGLIKDVGKVIDNLTTTDEERLAAKLKIEELLEQADKDAQDQVTACLLYTSPSPRDRQKSRMPSSA